MSIRGDVTALLSCIAFMAAPLKLRGAELIAPRIDQRRSLAAPISPLPKHADTAITDSPGAVYEAVAGDNAGQLDEGEQWLLKATPKPKKTTAFADVSAYYTSNAALTRTNEFGDSMFVAQIGVSHTEQLSRQVSADITLQTASFRYGRFDVLDFDSINVGGGLSWLARDLGDLTFFARYNYNRLTESGWGSTLLSDHSIIVGAQNTWQVTQASYLYLGQSSQFRWTDPKSLQRNEYGLYAGYGIQLTRALAGTLQYRVALLDYTGADRRDINQNMAVGLNYRVAEWLSINLSWSFGLNNSNVGIYSFDVINAGGGISGSLKF